MILSTESKPMDRTQGVGASDLGAVFNLKPYGCERQLFYEKRGVPADYPFLGNVHTRRGIFFEPIAADYYQQETGRELLTIPDERLPYKDETFPFITCHPDRIHVHTGNPAEIKCPSREMFRKIKAEGLPQAYILQLQQNIHLTKVGFGTFIVFCAETVELLHFDMERDQELIDLSVDAEKAFWSKVKDKAPEPERFKPSDARCHKCTHRTTCQGEHMLESVAPETDIPFVEDLAPLVEEFNEAKEIRKQADEYFVEVTDRLRGAMDKRTVADTHGARIYYRPQESMRWDSKALELAHPDLKKDFSKKQIARPLKVYPK